ncbi:MAG: hypothetical protein HYY55_04430 [Candidatus Niyogibacteria bacterium]|nr:MAG: hypothetical protein HYY55_04430 [Candidatus Niyogibacteria bacterium]
MRSVVFCTSQRFRHELDEFVNHLKDAAEKRGTHIHILKPNFDGDDLELAHLSEKDRLRDDLYRATVAGKVYDHLFRKVMVADVCFIFNKDGYIGANTNGELFAAAVLGKTIYALEDKTLMGSYPDGLYEEPSSRKFIHDVVSSPEELLKRLH